MKSFTITSSIRLPFEPKNDALELKKQIRDSLSLLKSDDSRILYAYLKTSIRDFFDVENLLFYNIGSGAFKNLSIDELCFELKHDPQICDYEYFYGLYDKSLITFENEKLVLIFETKIPEISLSTKPLDYWNYMNRSTFILANDIKLSHSFSIDIELELINRRKNLVSLIKPMIDGIISSLHYQNNVSENATNYISKKLGISQAEITEMLSEKQFSILGERNLVSEYREGIKWNPEDERCTKVRIRQYSAEHNMMRIRIYRE